MRTVSVLRNRGSFLRIAFAIVMVFWPLVLRNDYALSVMVMAGLYATLAVGLGLLLGQAGQISLGHAAFFGMGAYTGAILTTRLNAPPVLALAAGAALAGIVAYIIGRPVLRFKTYFLALATLGLGEIFAVFARETTWLTGGPVGIVAIPWLEIGSFAVDDYVRQYYVVWALVLALLFLTERALNSRVGRTLRALAVSEVAASTLGVYTADWKLRAFVVSAVYAGIGGGLYAFVMLAISWRDFGAIVSMLVVIMVMVGGMGSLFGAVIGAILMTWIGRAFSGYQEYSGSLYALVLILLLLFLPGGLAGGLRSEQVARLRALFHTLSGSLPFPSRRSRVGDIAPPGLSPAAAQSAAASIELQGAGPVAELGQLRGEGRARVVLPSTEEPLLRLGGVSVNFGGLQAVSQVSLSLLEGSIAALIGPNGAGKTTLFNVVSGLQQPSAGRVWFADQEITHLSAADIARLGMARTFQNLRVFGNMTVLENVMVGRHRHEKAGFISAAIGLRGQANEEKDSRKRSLEALALVGLDHLADWPVMSLPYGQQRLVEIARALATEPRLLLLDEPAAGMNASEKAQLVDKVARIRDTGVTVLLVEHDMNLVMGISDRVSVLDYGKLIAEGAPEDVQAHPAVIEAYLGVNHRSESGGGGQGPAVGMSPEPTREGKALLEVEHVSTYYGSIGAVRDVSLRVHPGEILAVLGSNGAGKTTLLRTISGVLRPRSGRITCGGRDITRLSPPGVAACGIGHVPEGRLIFPSLSVHDNLMLGAHRRRDQEEVRREWEFVYGLFPVLADRRRQVAGTLSGGEQQMLAIGRALMGGPRLLLLDEPSMGLAPLVVEHIFETLVTLNRRGLTLLMVEQNAEMALAIAHQAVVLQTGTVALAGPAAVLRQDQRVQGLYLGVKGPAQEASSGSQPPAAVST